MKNLKNRIKKLKDYENLKEILSDDLGDAIYELVNSENNDHLERKFDDACILIEKLYESGCLDSERDQLVQDWIKT